MSKKGGIIRLIAWLAVTCFIVYTAIFGLGSDHSGNINDISLGLDLRGGVSITYEVVGEATSQEVNDAKNKMERRVTDKSTEAQVYLEGSNRITVDIPGATDANEVLAELGKPGSLVFCTDPEDPQGSKVLDGNQIKDAQPIMQKNQTTGAYEYFVSLTLDTSAREAFSAATKELAPTRGIIYIIYDNDILSAPAVNSHIDSEFCTISGMADYQEASDLASNIRIGALPVELQELRSTVVGAKLGQDAVRTSLLAGAIGLVLVFLFMIAYYRLAGVIASIALVMYTGLVIVLISAFKEEITLTLPGIAGIILGIGMAVDANCVIFARIREELGQGATVEDAIKAGFEKAFSAILDGNVTTLIAAGVLFFLGSGTVKGFAMTLALGIVVSMFNALVITKSLMKCFLAIGFDDPKYYGKVANVKIINFIKRKKVCYIASLCIIGIGILSMVIHSFNGYMLNFSLEFVGGSSTSVTFNENRTIEQLEDEVTPVVSEVTGDNDIQMTPVANSNEVIIRTRNLDLEERTELYAKLAENFGVDETLIKTENISATVSSEMQRSAVIAVAVSALFMLIYVWIRFKDLSFGASSVIPLLHDVLVLLAFYAVLRWTVSNTFIACMLTLVGYSINATIVVFDRIRENLAMNEEDNLGRSDAQIVNISISQTLSRSINTSLTTLITVVVLYILGVTSIREFALPLIVGIICGCYSSVCIAGCLWYDMKNFLAKRRAAKEE